MLPGCDYNHWLIVMEFPKDPAPTREQMIETYLNTLATVLGRLLPFGRLLAIYIYRVLWVFVFELKYFRLFMLSFVLFRGWHRV